MRYFDFDVKWFVYNAKYGHHCTVYVLCQKWQIQFKHTIDSDPSPKPNSLPPILDYMNNLFPLKCDANLIQDFEVYIMLYQHIPMMYQIHIPIQAGYFDGTEIVMNEANAKWEFNVIIYINCCWPTKTKQNTVVFPLYDYETPHRAE